jgi:pimeloyl-ACP methyl ester carboxylesterase
VLRIDGALDPSGTRLGSHEMPGGFAAQPDRVVIPDAGHFPHEERPEAFTEALLGWLSERAAARVDGIG